MTPRPARGEAAWPSGRERRVAPGDDPLGRQGRRHPRGEPLPAERFRLLVGVEPPVTMTPQTVPPQHLRHRPEDRLVLKGDPLLLRVLLKERRNLLQAEAGDRRED